MRLFDTETTLESLTEAQVNERSGISLRLLQIAAMVLMLGACTGPETGSETSLLPDTSSSTSVPVEPDSIDADEALATADFFFGAVNAGDESEAFDLLAENAVISDSLAGELDAEESSNWLAWRIAQGTSFDNVDCTSGDSDGDRVTVSCDTAMLDALGSATNTSPAAVDATLAVSSEGISSVDLSYEPTIGETPSEFVDWVETQYPDDSDAAAAAGAWGDSVDESRERGASRAEFAQLWVDFALSSIEETFALYENKDLGGFGRWTEGGGIIGDNSLSEPEWFEADFESGPSYSLGSCVPDGLFIGFVIACNGSHTDLFGGRTGIVVETDWTFIVDETGMIIQTTDSTDYSPFIEFASQFQDWMTANYPSVQDSVKWIRPWLAAAEDWETVRPLVDEFVAQSDDYPVGG